MTFRACFIYTDSMEKKVVQLYVRTYDNIIKNKNEKNIATFIDDAVNYYVASASDKSDIKKIKDEISGIKETQRTILGINCEILRQAGMLNGNGEIDILKKKS